MKSEERKKNIMKMRENLLILRIISIMKKIKMISKKENFKEKDTIKMVYYFLIFQKNKILTQEIEMRMILERQNFPNLPENLIMIIKKYRMETLRIMIDTKMIEEIIII
jgi:hypothetical protein